MMFLTPHLLKYMEIASIAHPVHTINFPLFFSHEQLLFLTSVLAASFAPLMVPFP